MAGSSGWSGGSAGVSYWSANGSDGILAEKNVLIKGDDFPYFNLFPNLGIMNGRLTLTTGTPVTTSDVTAATTLYYTPYNGNVVCVYNGTDTWTFQTFSEISITNSGLAVDTNYDVYLHDNSGTLTLSFTAWTNSTNRATALATQDGQDVKTGATNYRYIGSICTDAAGKFEDSATNRYVWNRYNKVDRPLKKTETTTSWTVTAPGSWTWSQLNSNSNNKISVIVGKIGEKIKLTLSVLHSVNPSGTAGCGIGVDVTNANSGICPGSNSSTTILTAAQCEIQDYVSLGKHNYNMLQLPNSTNNTTFYGNISTGNLIGGMIGNIMA